MRLCEHEHEEFIAGQVCIQSTPETMYADANLLCDALELLFCGDIPEALNVEAIYCPHNNVSNITVTDRSEGYVMLEEALFDQSAPQFVN